MTTPEVKQGEVSKQPQDQPPEQEPVKEISVVTETPATHTPGQAAAQAAADATQQQPVATPTPTVTITIPATTEQLDDWSKGPPENALTWLAFYWIRMIKKALLHGWGVVSSVANTQALFAF